MSKEWGVGQRLVHLNMLTYPCIMFGRGEHFIDGCNLWSGTAATPVLLSEKHRFGLSSLEIGV